MFVEMLEKIVTKIECDSRFVPENVHDHFCSFFV